VRINHVPSLCGWRFSISMHVPDLCLAVLLFHMSNDLKILTFACAVTCQMEQRAVICFLPLKGLNPGEICSETESVDHENGFGSPMVYRGTHTFSTREPSSREIQGLGDRAKVIWLRQFRQCDKNVHLHHADFLIDTPGLRGRRASESYAMAWDFKSSMFDAPHALLMPRKSEIVSCFASGFSSPCTEGNKTSSNM
jgi:hypothetical protein